MIVLLDANVLIRLSLSTDPLHHVAVEAISLLFQMGYTLQHSPQAQYEFWVVATRPITSNGLGLTIPECVQELDAIEEQFPLIDDPPELASEWRRTVETFSCLGKNAHDARYIAVMNRHRINRLLTFNVADFARFVDHIVIDPRAVVRQPELFSLTATTSSDESRIVSDSETESD